MHRFAAALIMFSLLVPAAYAQKLTTQPRSGLGDAGHPTNPSNATPAGAMNAQTGPQAHPAYPSGSTTPNPGAALVRATSPKPASGAIAKPPGTVTTTIATGRKTARHPVGQAATPPK